ncbi:MULTISPECIES: flagellar hook-associated protein FlgK [unclassified Methylibium]|uniref:flagellar hook-associated protein FlgK n=1 Tax=unclassified Methylibium TaxID=2633235 RepID=UPI0003F3D069|nr:MULTISPECIES: flagellar hook-associated protein FlgK [unclassified Methylibium]EWS54762.1 Flagellar hook-associated protein 1 [Methylibium sp. T29]EWS61400.1 Flagellar hook-associated protein 1 [Methylibium sp. T29-B]
MAGLMSLGTRAMFANYATLQTIGNNIANANTPGYSRQQVELGTAGGQSTGAGFFGQGVSVQTVTRASDAFLTRDAAMSKSQAARDVARLEQLERLEKVFPTGESGLGYAAGDLLNAFVDVANRPQDASARQVVLARAEELASRFRAADSQLDALQSGVTEDVKNSVTVVNTLAKRVADINRQIAAAQGSGHAPNDLLDQRDQLISEIGSYVQVTTIEADDGSLGVFIGGGQRLVLGSNAQQLKVVPDAYDAAKVRLAISEAGGERLLPEDSLVAGKLPGLLAFQNQDLADARAMIGQLASAIAGAVNRQQSLGLDLGQPAGSGAPLFALGAPAALPASTNARDAGGNFLSSVSLTVADPKQLQASDYELRTDASTPGQYFLTRLSDGVTRTVADGDTVDGFTLAIGTPAPGATDRFLLQPVSQAAQGMARVLNNPNGIAASSPVVATVASGNTGTATVGSLTVTSTALDPTQTANISFTDDSGNYNWELRDAGNAVVSSGTGTWTAGSTIALNGFELTLAGVPRSGDAVQVAPTTFPAANNGNALSLLALRDAGIVGEQLLAGGVVSAGESITSAYASAMADIGVRVQSARSSSNISTAVATNAEAARAGVSGVNLDEEAARLIQFQQAYQAAAKVLQVAQSVFDTLLSVAAR